MPPSTTDKKHTTHNAKDATICKNADRSYKMKKAETDQLDPVYKMTQSTVNSQQIKQSTNQDARVYRCKKSMKMQKESEQQSTAKMMKMPHSMKMKQSTAKMPQEE